MSDPALIEQIIRAEEISRPRYAALNLADLRTYQQGLLGMQEAATRQAGQLEREQLALQRAADIAAVEDMGGRATAALRAADPYAARIAELSQQAAERAYGQAGQVTPEQMRMAQQQARSAGLARGRVGDASTIAAEILGREDVMARRRAEAAQLGQLSFNMNRAISADPFQAILGRGSGALGYGAQQQAFTQQLGASPIGPRAVDYSSGVNLALQNAANLGNYQASTYGARAAAQGQIAGATIGALGDVASAFVPRLPIPGLGGTPPCWVAREVYGEDNPKWVMFREWLLTKSPMWFRTLYIKHGERFAAFLRNKPSLKRLIRKWMDSRIQTLALA